MEFGWLSIIPPLFAILLAIKTRQVFLSLFLGIVVGWIIISGGNILRGFELAIQSIVDVFQDAGNTRVVIFCALVGALISLTQANGGVQGFVDFIQKKNIVTSRRRATVFSFFVGCVVFIESSISCLVTGTIFHPIFEKFKVSREKLAYICDTTIVSSMASACDHIDHVRTQLPYALFIAVLSALLFWLTGVLK